MTNSGRLGIATAVVLAVALSGGVAVGAGKITSKQIAKNAVLAKHIKVGAVGSGELADGSVNSADLAAAAVGGPQLADGAVTGAKVDESTLGTVPNAAAVGGVTVVPVTASLADGASGINLYNADGLRVIIDCGTPVASKANTEFVALGSPVTVDASRTGEAAFTQTFPAGGGVSLQATNGRYTVTAWRASGGSTILQLTSFYLTDAIGTNDCFFRGTVSTTP